MSRTEIGFIEKIKIGNKILHARIDTGAAYSSICTELAEKLELGPTIKHIKVRTSNGEERRPVVEAEIEIKGKKIKTLLNIADRKNMIYPILIGRRVLRSNFIINPSK